MKRSLDSTTNYNQGVQVINEDLKTHPSCSHGPTLLFSRHTHQEQRQFFACSACRDRKLCNFFLWADEFEKIKKTKLDAWKNERINFIKGINHRKLFLLLNKVKAALPQKREYCTKCSTFTHGNENKHVGHPLLSNITDYQLEHPSEILSPLNNPKKEAQYLFSKSSVKVLVDIFKDLNYQNVICIGTPRIHEYIQYECKNMSSILLDIDQRFHSFFGPLSFCWYNSFNNHFFFKEGQEVFKDFLDTTGGENTVLVTDPPFGGRTEPLAHTFTMISNQFSKLSNGKNNLPIFWIFPYFMEPQILNSLPSFHMLDYKVEYDNHPLFQNGPKGRKQGSPVRIFTNIIPSLIKLPSDSYKFCKNCDKWVSKENIHCEMCNCCTSKNGETYVHCNICQKCVKPKWKHCKNCDRCAQIVHKCEDFIFNGVCLRCKKPGHKRNKCPKLLETVSISDTAVKNKNKKICVCCKKPGHKRNECPKLLDTVSINDTAVKNKNKKVCLRCKKPGHKRNECPKLLETVSINDTAVKNKNKKVRGLYNSK